MASIIKAMEILITVKQAVIIISKIKIDEFCRNQTQDINNHFDIIITNYRNLKQPKSKYCQIKRILFKYEIILIT